MNEEQFKKLKNINHWSFDGYRASHKSGHKRWMANGIFFFTESESKHTIKLNFWQWIDLYKWLKCCAAEQAIIKAETSID